MDRKILARMRVPSALAFSPFALPFACMALGCDCELLCPMAGTAGCLVVASATSFVLVAALGATRELQLLATLDLRGPRH